MKLSLNINSLSVSLICLLSLPLYAGETPTSGLIEINAKKHLSLPQILPVMIDSDRVEDDIRKSLEHSYEVLTEKGVLISDEAKFILYVKKLSTKSGADVRRSIKMSGEGSNKKLDRLQLDIPQKEKNQSKAPLSSSSKYKEISITLEGPAGTPYWIAAVKGKYQPPGNIGYSQLIKAGLAFFGENHNQTYPADNWQ